MKRTLTAVAVMLFALTARADQQSIYRIRGLLDDLGRLTTDLAKEANFVVTFRKTEKPETSREPRLRRVTHVCRECGEHAVLDPPEPLPASWTCPWCGKQNPLGGAR